MHPARLILSTAAVAVPGPEARVGLPKKDVGAAHVVVADGLVVGPPPGGVFVIPTAAAATEAAGPPPRRPASAHAPAGARPGGGGGRGGDDADDGPRPFGGQCRPGLGLVAGGKKGLTVLEAQCEDARGQWWRTSLNLNRCIGAHDGELVYQDRGDFDSLCWPCVVVGDDTAVYRLVCTCLDHLGNPKTAALKLGSQAEHPHAVQPSDGRLVCGKHEGDRTPFL